MQKITQMAKQFYLFTKKVMTNRRGIALLLVSVMIAIMLPIVVDMNYEAKTEYEIAMNYKKKAEALALAQSAVSFAEVVFDLQDQVDGYMKQMKQFGMNMNFKIWDIVPFDTAMLRAFTSAGPFATVEDLADPDLKNKDGGEEDLSEMAQYDQEGDPLFKFPGDFRLEFENEEQKINLNLINSGTKEVIKTMLLGIISPEIYDFIFLENTDRPEYVTREELIEHIVGWIDGAGSDQGLYADFNPPYQMKGARLDTISELKMIYGVNDIIYRLLYPHVTIYSVGKININKASPEMLESIIRAYATDQNLPIFYNQDSMREFMGKLLAKKAKDGFNDVNSFVKAVRELEVPLKPTIRSAITAEATIYRIKAIGSRDGVESWIEIVVDKERNYFYYREG